MAVLLRRTSSSTYRNLSLLLRTTPLHSRHFSYSVFSPNLRNSATTRSLPNSPAINFLLESRRGFAKGRKPNKEEEEDYDDKGNSVGTVNIGPSVKSATVSQMEAALEALSRELRKLRTGRASAGMSLSLAVIYVLLILAMEFVDSNVGDIQFAGMLDHIIVETGGVKMPLSRIAVVSVLDSKTLSVTPYDPNALKELEKAIISSPLGINPKSDNQRLIAAIPPLTKEHMQAVCKVVAKSSEDVKQSIRRTRQKALDTIKKALPKKKDKDKAGSSFSGDDAKRLEKEIDDLTKKFIKSAEDMCKAKEKEITQG
ncbi:unnamed protein product [Ilex paraguariensis]|uniref:Ribosome-recycling factor, chloroplastic n=1 Tax=Ilex paraguariensis TaxID=185542 RepID=A0ABC8T2N1_9AQUA